MKKPFLQVHFDRSSAENLPSTIPKIYSDFEERIGYKFENKGLLVQSLTHSSFKSILHTTVDKNNINQICKRALNNSISFQQAGT